MNSGEIEAMRRENERLRDELETALAWHTVASAERDEMRGRAHRAEYVLGKLSDLNWVDDHGGLCGSAVVMRLVNAGLDSAAAARVGAVAQQEAVVTALRVRVRALEEALEQATHGGAR